MVKISLQISCQLENIEELKAEENFSYFLKLRCNNCGESDDIWHDLCEGETVQQGRSGNSKGNNMVIKCKMCARENSIDIVEKSAGKTVWNNQQLNLMSILLGTYKEDDAGKFKTILQFDCRGNKLNSLINCLLTN